MLVLRRRGGGRAWLPAVLGTALVFGAAGIALATAARPIVGDDAKIAAVDATSAWIRANVPPGTRIALSEFLAYDVGQRVTGDYPVTRIRPGTAVLDPTAPLGLRAVPANRPLADAIAISPSLYNVDQFDERDAASLTKRIQTLRPGYWVHATLGDGTPAMTAALDATPGASVAQRWTYPYGDEQMTVTVYRIDPDVFAPDPARLFIDPGVLDRIIDKLEAAGPGVGETADRLRERVTITPSSPDDARPPGAAGGPPRSLTRAVVV